jgi:hypothetical protein
MRRGRHPDQGRRDDRTAEINLLLVINALHVEAGAVVVLICHSADLLSLSFSLVVEHPTEPLALAELILTRIRTGGRASLQMLFEWVTWLKPHAPR